MQVLELLCLRQILQKDINMVHSIIKEFSGRLSTIVELMNKWSKDNNIEIKGLTISKDSETGYIALVYYNVRKTED